MFKVEDVSCIKEMDKAVLCDCAEWDDPKWVPKSQVEEESEVYKKGTEGTLIVSDWFAEKEGW